MRFLLPFLLVVVLFAAELLLGSVFIPPGEILQALGGQSDADATSSLILFESRLPRAWMAAIAGGSLALAGWMMQTIFRNPLAGPSVLGISSGSSLGVALVVLAASPFFSSGDTASLPLHALIATGAILGALAVLVLVLMASRLLPDNTSLLIFGIMLSFFVSAVVDALQFSGSNESLRTYVNWGMGNFANAGTTEILSAGCVLLISAIIIWRILPVMDLLLLGEDYAQSMGVSTRNIRLLLIIITGLLSGIITAWCGPVAFIGLATPHLARMMLRTSAHRPTFLPVVLLGCSIALFCDLIARLTALPLNTVCSALGAPVILLILLRGKNTHAVL